MGRVARLITHVLIALAVGACVQHAQAGPEFEAEIGLPDPVEVGVSAPNGEFFWLMRDDVSCPGVSYDDGKLTVRLQGLSGVQFGQRSEVSTPVFTHPGTYTLMVADNLETELDNSFSRTFDIVVAKDDKLLVGPRQRQCTIQ